jgi:hypothetical protein
LEYVINPHPPTLSAPNRIPHSGARLRRDYNADFLYPRILEIVEDVKKNGPISHRHELFRSCMGQWTQPRTSPTTKNQTLQFSAWHVLSDRG